METVYKTSDVALILGVSDNTIRSYVHQGLLTPAFRTLKGQMRFTQSQVDELVKKRDGISGGDSDAKEL